MALLAGCVASAPSSSGRVPQSGDHGAKAHSAADIEQGFRAILQSTDIDGRPVGEAAGEHATALVIFASWCGPCRYELGLLRELMQEEPRLRVIGLSFAAYEEYAERSDDSQLRAFLNENAPWLQVVRIGDRLMDALGRPRKVPTLFLFDARGRLIEAYVRSRRTPPTKEELRASVMAALGRAGRE